MRNCSYLKIDTDITENSEYNAFYDGNHNLIQTVFALTNDKIKIPENAVWVMFSCENKYSLGDVTLYSFSSLKEINECDSNLMHTNEDIFKKIVWKQGVYYDTGYNPLPQRKFCIIYVNECSSLKFVFNNSNFYLYLYKFYEDGSYTYITLAKSQTVYLENDIKFVSLIAYRQEDRSEAITDSEWDEFDIECYARKEEHLKIATWNVGVWNNGVTACFPDDEVDERSVIWRKMIGKNDADIMMLQETTKYLDVSSTINPMTQLFAFKYDGIYSDEIKGGKSIVSRFILRNTERIAFSVNESRSFLKSYIFVNGRKICLLDAHTSFEEDFNETRKAQFEELVSIMETEEYAILCGDFNAFSTSEFDTFSNAGLNVANHGIFGDYNTWPGSETHSTWHNGVIDNIITTPNISIQYVYIDSDTGKNGFSDHCALFAKLKIK